MCWGGYSKIFYINKADFFGFKILNFWGLAYLYAKVKSTPLGVGW